MSDKTLVFLDIETTGLDPFKNEIIEVAMLKRTPGSDRDASIRFSLNIDPSAADAKALEVNRYHERAEELAAIQVRDDLAGRLLTAMLEDAVIIGNNPQFDLRFIEIFLKRNTNEKDPTPWNYHPVDLKALVAGALGLGEPPWSTKAVAEASGVPLPEDAHSAVVDAAWNRDVYDSVFNYTANRCVCGVPLPRHDDGRPKKHPNDWDPADTYDPLG